MVNPGKELYDILAAGLGGKPELIRYAHLKQSGVTMGVMIGRDVPTAGVTSFATFGLSKIALGQIGSEYRLELISGCLENSLEFGSVLATAAFHIIDNCWNCRPGLVLENAVAISPLKTQIALKHLYFAPPFPWETWLTTLDLDDRQVRFLYTVPISDGERDYHERHGAEDFEAWMEKNEVDMFDLHRKPLI